MSDLVTPKNSLATTLESQTTIDIIASKVSSLVAGNEELKTDLELVKYVANSVENTITDKTADKSTIVTNIFLKVFPNLTSHEQIFIKKAITFLQNNEHIKKASMFKYIRVGIKNFVFKKLL